MISLEVRRHDATAPDPAIVAAIAVAIEYLDGASAPAPERTVAISPWRAAGRSIDAFDAYDAARYVRRNDAPKATR